MNDNYESHMAPLDHLVKVVLHKGKGTAELVRQLRKRRRGKKPLDNLALDEAIGMGLYPTFRRGK